MRLPLGTNTAGVWIILSIGCILGETAGAQQQTRPKHPNLLLNREEIEQVKTKVRKDKWAANLLNVLRDTAGKSGSNHGGLPYSLLRALTGEESYGATARNQLLKTAHDWLPRYEKADMRLNPPFGGFAPVAQWAWSYDLIFDILSEPERQLVEKVLRAGARAIIEGARIQTTNPGLVFDEHWQVGVVGYCLGEAEFINWALHDATPWGPEHGGFYPQVDSRLKDKLFWDQAPLYAMGVELHGSFTLAEAALHYDNTNLYRYVSPKSGATIKNMIDAYLRTAFPLETTGIERGTIRIAAYGDAGTSYSPTAELSDLFLVNGPRERKERAVLAGDLELAYRRFQDPAYAWFISLNPKRDVNMNWGRALWGYVALTQGQPLPETVSPPPAPSGVYPGQGIAMLRSDESPQYWTSGALAALLRLGVSVGHGHKDYFSLILHGKGRLLYPDLNVINYEPTYLNWTHEGFAHSTLLVDHQSPHSAQCQTRQEFTREAKFVAATGSAFEGVTQTRALLMTPEYLADVFHARDNEGQQRIFDWVLHGLGRLYPGHPSAYRESHALEAFYWWVDHEQGRKTDASWQVDWVQQSAGLIPGMQISSREWFGQTVGVRMMMAGSPGTEVYVGEGPVTDGPPYGRIEGNAEGSAPLVVARRTDSAATFAAVHYPYEKKAPPVRIRKVQETADAVGVAVDSGEFSDRVLVSFSGDKEQTVGNADGESFTFRNYGYLRVTGSGVAVRGSVSAYRVRLPDGAFKASGVLTRNLAAVSAPNTSGGSIERAASVHYYFLPEEAHLEAGAEKEIEMFIRCVGDGESRGQLRFVAPKEIRVEPSTVDVAGMRDGDGKKIRLRLKAPAGSANALHRVRIESVEDAPAAKGVLLISVGVTITADKRVPLLSQSIVRAPGYTMTLDQLSGVSYHLLDADGHRRHGRLHNDPACTGIPALSFEKEWVFQYGQPCRLIFENRNVLTAVNGSGLDQVRLQYSFGENQIDMELVQPTHPYREYTMSMGNFDLLGQPTPKGPTDWLFLPHPVYRQGLLLLFPQKLAARISGTSISFPMRFSQKVTLRFAAEGEVPRLIGARQASLQK